MVKRRKILICIPSYTYGGAEIHSHYTARSLQADPENEVFFLAFGRIDSLKDKLETEGFQTLHFPMGDFLSLGSFRKMKLLFRLILFLRPFKFEFVFSGTEQCNLLMGLVWKKVGAKRFFWHQWGIDSRPTMGFWEKKAAKSKPDYIANSEACKENVIKRHGITDQNRVQIVHNTFDETILKVVPQVNALDVNVVMLANYFEEKDHATVLRALRIFKDKYPSSSLKIYFAGRDNGSKQLLQTKALAFDLELVGSVFFLGLVEDVAQLLATMQIGILSTKSEGLSNALLEYMAAGLPVIATDISQNREALGHENNEGLFPVGDVEACFERLEKLVLDANLRTKVGDNNRIVVQENFSNQRYQAEVQKLVHGTYN